MFTFCCIYFLFNPGEFSFSVRNIVVGCLGGVIGLIYQFLIGYACRLEKKASNVAIIFTMQIVFSFILGRIFLGDEIFFLNVLGALLVSGSGILIMISKEIQTGNKEVNNEKELSVELIEAEN